MKNFWLELPKPFFTLAPMYDVTDSAFRQMFVRYGQPDVFFTEFVSVDGLLNDQGRSKVLRELYFKPNEHKIVAQIFGSDPAKFYEAAKLIAGLGFDGIDINMGCPDKTIIKQCAGSALIKKPEIAQAIIEATKRGAPNLPVSVKTRIGYSKPDELENWLGEILKAQPALLTVHLRTVKEMSKVPAHWELAPAVVALARQAGVLIMANGDIGTLAEAKIKAESFKLDGVMIGRGAFGNPWFFSGQTDISHRQKLEVAVEHSAMFEDLYGSTKTNQELFGGHTKNFAIMKKHFKAYVKDFPGAAPLRAKLMEAKNASEVKAIINHHLVSQTLD